jgi:hypothetical protein
MYLRLLKGTSIAIVRIRVVISPPFVAHVLKREHVEGVEVSCRNRAQRV